MSDLNVTPAVPSARAPRGAVKLNGEIITGWQSWEVDNNAYRSADTFRVVFVVAALPATRNAAWFALQASMLVEILAGFPANPDAYTPGDLDSLILGQVDEIRFDPVAGTIELTGRDLTALFIDTKVTAHYKEQTASEIANILTLAHSELVPVVTDTTDVTGQYYEYDRVTLVQDQSEWEILNYLANVEDFMVYVKGYELHFEPRPDPSTNHYVIEWSAANADRAHPVANVMDLSFSRALTIAKGVSVEVRSWNATKSGKPVIATFPKAAKAATPGQFTAKTQLYKRYIPGLDHAQAQKRAEAIYRQIIAHEMHLTGYLPADNVLDCTKTILVRGTDTAFDQVYYPESVQRTMSMAEGYRMNIRAKNTGPELESAL